MNRPLSATGSRQYWPVLDGLRAVAVVSVMIYHLTWEEGNPGGPGLVPSGYLGVDVFFVLSGFLITWLLIGEWDERRGRVSFRNFYTRRVLRLFPALGCVIITVVVLAAFMEFTGAGPPWVIKPTLDGLPWVLAFVGNWAEAFGLGNLGLLGHTWSLAVEEQFYLLWPVLLVLIIRRRLGRDRVALWLAVIAATDMIYRMVMSHLDLYSADRIYFGMDTHCDGLLVGSAVAFWLASGRAGQLHPVAAGLLKVATGVGAIGLLTLLMLPASISGIAGAVLASGVVLVGLVIGSGPVTLECILASQLAVWVGRRSYGLYIWHFVIYLTIWSLYRHYLLALSVAGLGGRVGIAVVDATAIAVSVMAAALSYRFVESPALRLRRRFRGGALHQEQALLSTPLPG